MAQQDLTLIALGGNAILPDNRAGTIQEQRSLTRATMRQVADWVALGARIMRDYAPYVPFMDRAFPKFESAQLHGQVFNNTFYELFPSLWLSR